MIFKVPSKPSHSMTLWTYHESYHFSVTSSNSITAQLLWQDTPLSGSIVPYLCGKLSIALSIVVTCNKHCRLVFPLPGDTLSSSPKLWSFPHPSLQRELVVSHNLTLSAKVKAIVYIRNNGKMQTWCIHDILQSTTLISKKLLLFSFKKNHKAYQILIFTIRVKNQLHSCDFTVILCLRL